MQEKSVLWKDRKRTIFGLPLSFTKYILTEDKFIVESGLFSTKEEEVRLYRIMDVTLKRNFGQKLWGLGTIHCCSADKSTPEFDIKNVKKSREVKELLSEQVENQRTKKRVSSREYMIADDDSDET